MRVRADGAVRTGTAVDLTALDVEGRAVVRAVRGEASPVDVDCPSPSPVHELVGHVGAGATVPVRTALAAVARRRGVEAPQDGRLREVRAELASLDLPEVGLADERERVAAVDDDALAELREEVAARRGALRARERLDADRTPADERLLEAAGRLADAETDKLAAEQALDCARERAREARDVRERRLRLQDRAANLEREAREHLAGRLREPFVAAVDAVPGDGTVPGRPASFEGDPTTAALALARLADLRAPAVLECDRFTTPHGAARRLDAPVIRV